MLLLIGKNSLCCFHGELCLPREQFLKCAIGIMLAVNTALLPWHSLPRAQADTGV